MSMNYNRVTLVGTITSAPKQQEAGESRKTTFEIRIKQPATKEDGSVVYDIVPIAAYGRLAELVNTCLSVGQHILVEGRIDVQTYIDAGKHRHTFEINVEEFHRLTSFSLLDKRGKRS